MTVLEMSKGHKSDKLKLIKEEEEAREEKHCETQPNKCERRCKVMLCYGGVIGMLILIYFLVILFWNSHINVLNFNETVPILYLYRRKRAPETVIGLQSKNNENSNKNDNHVNENKYSQNVNDHRSYKQNYFNENSDVMEKFLENIIENEQINSEVKQYSYENNNGRIEQEVEGMKEQAACLGTAEDEEKLILNNNFLRQNKDVGINNAENIVSRSHNLDTDFHYKTDIKKMQHEDALMEENTNIHLGLYFGMILIIACGILILLFGLSIHFLFNIISSRKICVHRKSEEEENEINNKLYSLRNTPPSTPNERDLCSKENRKKINMYCELYS